MKFALLKNTKVIVAPTDKFSTQEANMYRQKDIEIKLQNGDTVCLDIMLDGVDSFFSSGTLFRNNCEPRELTDDELDSYTEKYQSIIAEAVLERYGYWPD